MPVIGMVGSADFSNYFLPLSRNVTATNLADAQKQGPVLAWGSFATYIVNFLIVAAALFFMFKLMNNAEEPHRPRAREGDAALARGGAAGRDPRSPGARPGLIRPAGGGALAFRRRLCL